MKKILVSMVVMVITMAAFAQYDETPADPNATKLKILNKEISKLEKRMDKKISTLTAFEVRELATADEDKAVEIKASYGAQKDSVTKSYTAQLKPLREAKIKLLAEMSAPAPVAAAATEFSGIIDNPLWVDVNIAIFDQSGNKTSYYLARNSSLKVELPAGEYTAARMGSGNYRIGNTWDFKVSPEKKHIYKGCEVSFYLVAYAQ